MELYFLRHALAAEPGTVEVAHDSERPLLPEGAEKMRRAAAGMKRLGLEFDRIVSSPYLRAKQTAEIVADVYKFRGKLRFAEALTPQASFKDLARLLQDFDASAKLLLVGHQPSMGDFVSELAFGQGGATIEIKKGSLCFVELASGSSRGVLKWLLTPKQMREYAG